MTDDDTPGTTPAIPAEFGPMTAPSAGRGTAMAAVPTSAELVADSMISPPLRERMSVAGPEEIGVMIELRLRFPGGAAAAAKHVMQMLNQIRPTGPMHTRVTGAYLSVGLTAAQILELVRRDAGAAEAPASDPVRVPRAAIHRLWPNFGVTSLIIRSIVTTKCQAVHRAFNATGRDIVWAVVDSGIQDGHGHFDLHRNLKDLPHRSFVSAGDDPLRDDAGHGTHVAGILAGEQIAPDGDPLTAALAYWDEDAREIRQRPMTFPSISGMAPECRLLSCKVLNGDETGDVASLIDALQYIGELNQNGQDLLVHGVNLSVGYPFDPSWFATGLTPLCREVDNLVHSGVVVVVAAGNTGYGAVAAGLGKFTAVKLGVDMTINDPGNAALAITVGSTSMAPHATGVSYFSSKGPTGDGRMKPDLVAPGERVVSAAAGTLLEQARRVSPQATYGENSGTSMAAPHVSGAAAAFMSVHREFIGRPEAVSRALVSTATDLGRARNFQGAGLIDAMRAIQSV
jgi:serine protease AprX